MVWHASNIGLLAKGGCSEYKRRVSNSNAIAVEVPSATESDGWGSAAVVIDELRPSFSPLSGYVRLLNLPHGDDLRLKGVKDRVVAQFLRTPSLRSGLTRLANNLYSGRLPTGRPPTPRELTEILDFEVCSAFLSVLYFYRRVSRIAGDNPQWRGFVELAHHRGDIGYYLGTSLPGLGGAAGLLVGSLRSLALGYLAFRDPAGFRPYHEHLRARQLSFDVGYELTNWGFSHAQVAALFLQRMGHGSALPIALVTGLSPGRLRGAVDQRAAHLRAAAVWIDSVYRSAKPPALLGEDQIGLSRGEVEQLLSNVRVMVESKSRTFWLDRGEETTPGEMPEM